jgi:CheY-like chemotaxis protein
MSAETVLVVDDEPLVLRLAATALEREGFAVLAAEGADEALEVSRRFPGRIDLVLTDVCMPRMRGNELGTMLMARRPELRVLYMSGDVRRRCSKSPSRWPRSARRFAERWPSPGPPEPPGPVRLAGPTYIGRSASRAASIARSIALRASAIRAASAGS